MPGKGPLLLRFNRTDTHQVEQLGVARNVVDQRVVVVQPPDQADARLRSLQFEQTLLGLATGLQTEPQTQGYAGREQAGHAQQQPQKMTLQRGGRPRV